jgi:hypothetical protein
MPLPGGPSDKYGNRYEGKWTAYCIAQVMAEEADSIHLEPVGEEGEGCEFTLRKGPITEYHQVKRQHAHTGDWSIAELERRGVLRHAFEKTKDKNARFVFVSTISAGLLSGLVDGARGVASVTEFKQHFIKGDKNDAWNKLLSNWRDLIRNENNVESSVSGNSGNDLEELISFERLKRIEIRNPDEVTLTEMVEAKLRTLALGDGIALRCELCAFALEKIHIDLFADTIWSYVDGRGYRRVDYSRDRCVLAAVEALNARYARMIKGIGSEIKIAREEGASILEILKGDGRKNSALVSGDAGVGKTCVLGQTIQKLREEGIPHLYFRVDRLDPTNLPRDVGQQLDLPSSPAEVLAGIARRRLCVLIVDQLDAVSFVSGRNPGFFECIHEIIRQARAFPNMRMLMACRRFDIEKDNRLRELVSDHGLAQEINIKPFTTEKVKAVLLQLGCKSSDYTASQIELLRLPLHLSILANVLQEPRDKPFAFVTAVDLFGAYWELKHRAVRSRVGEVPDQWIKVLWCLCEKMTARQTLFVPEQEVLDDYEATVRSMESEGVLVLDERRIGFFHEGFFDYVFARLFYSKGNDLVGYLMAGEQGLFKRAPLRQILLYIHDSDPKKFVKELRCVVLNPGIRFHLRRCAMDVAGKVNQASEELWRLFNEIADSKDKDLQTEVWRVVWSTPAWFVFLNEKGIIKKWLASTHEEERRRGIALVRSQVEHYPDACVALLLPYVNTSDQWTVEILHVIWRDVLCSHRSVFELFMRILEAGAFRERGRNDFWMYMHRLPKEQPTWAAEALKAYLLEMLSHIQLDDVNWNFLEKRGFEAQIPLEIAEKVPAAYLDAVLPFFIKVVKDSGKEREGRLAYDSVWTHRTYHDEYLSVEENILVGIEKALKELSRVAPHNFERFLNELMPLGHYDSINFVVIRVLAVAPVEYSKRTLDYVLTEPARLEAGWTSASGGDFSHWAARELVSHLASLSSQDVIERLERHIVSYFPQWERTNRGKRWRGEWQLLMLTAIPLERLSPAGNARLDEWHRKFPSRKIEAPVPSKAHWVGSPITGESVKRMTDAQWLRAIAVYDEDKSKRRTPGELFIGGAHQLSGVLEAEVKNDPLRFAKLVKHFPVVTHRYYFHAVLRGLKDSSVNKETVFDVVRHIFAMPTKPGHRYLCDAITKFGKESISDEMLKVVGWCATEADDPESSNLTVHTQGEGDHMAHDLLSTAINSVRGAAADAVGDLLFDDVKRLEFFLPYIERMVCDPTAVVRCTAAHALLALYNIDEVYASKLFLNLTDCAEDCLLETHYVERFLYYANMRHFNEMRPVLRRMLDSKSIGVRETGARLVCLAQFATADAKVMADECVFGDDAKREGASKVAACNLFDPKCMEFSHATLPAFFNDPVKEVRDEAAQCFRKAEDRDLESATDVIRVFLQSLAFKENIDDLLWPLKSSTADVAEEILLTCETVVEHAEKTFLDASDRFYIHMGSVAELLLRAYRTSDSEEIRNRCLDIIDRLLAVRVHDVEEELNKFER